MYHISGSVWHSGPRSHLLLKLVECGTTAAAMARAGLLQIHGTMMSAQAAHAHAACTNILTPRLNHFARLRTVGGRGLFEHLMSSVASGVVRALAWVMVASIVHLLVAA